MSRKDTLRALLSDRHGELPVGNSNDLDVDIDTPVPAVALASLVRTGAVGAMGRSLGRIAAAAEDARAMISAGDAVVELDPSLIEASFLVDRLEEDPVDHQALVASIRESGQQVPILLRPHPEKSGIYQVAYGHRRLRAVTALGRPVRAVVRELSDAELVLAQGQENSARMDLSYIERAQFAVALEDHGFERGLIMAALSVEKTQLSKLITVSRSIPASIAKAIGSAPKAGRPRWMALAERLGQKRSEAIVAAVLSDDAFRSASSDTRFVRLFDALAPIKKVARATAWSADDGVKVALIKRNVGRFVLDIDEVAAPEFGNFLVEQLGEMYRAFQLAKSNGG